MHNARRLVLASASPRRRDLLARLRVPFEVIPSGVAESIPDAVSTRDAARGLALAKARDVARRVGPAIVLGADTLVAVGERRLGKPRSPEEARAMLILLAGRAHEVVTAVAVVDETAGREVTATVVSGVVMRAYSAEEIEAYLLTGEPDDKAGAYAVQGEGRRLVLRVEGCYTNVVGLPLTTTARLLRLVGVPAVEPEPEES